MKWTARIAVALIFASLLAIPTGRAVRSLRMTRSGVTTFTRLLASANAGDLDAVRSLCSGRYLGSHQVVRSAEGGVVGLPRMIHKNFQAWVEGDDVWLCPTDRLGPVYRLVLEEEAWKFDGLVGLLHERGQIEAVEEVDGGLTGRQD